MRHLIAAVALLTTVLGGPVAAEPVTVDTLLGMEDFGRIEIDPTGRWIVVERLRAQADWPRYDLGWLGGRLYGDLYVAPTDGSTELRPLFPYNGTVGYSLAALSPDGEKAAVYRLEGDRFRLGIVTLSTGATVWSSVAPAVPLFGRALEWIDPRQLIALGSSDGNLPYGLSRAISARRRLPDLWAAAARGEPAFSIEDAGPNRIASPRYGDVALWRIDVESGEAVALARGAFTDFELSWDGQTAAILIEGSPRFDTADGQVAEVRRQRSLRLINIQSGEALDPRGAEDVSEALLSWAPDGHGLLVYDRRQSRYLVVERSGRLQPLDRSLAPLRLSLGEVPEGGWIGGDPVVRGRRVGEEPRTWWRLAVGGTSPVIGGGSNVGPAIAQLRNSLLLANGEQLLRLGPDDGVQDLGRRAAVSPAGGLGQRGMTDPMKRSFAFTLGATHICRVTEEIRPACLAAVASGQMQGWAGRATYWKDRDGRGVTFLRRQAGGNVVSLMSLNEATALTSAARPHRVQVNGASGWLYLPEVDENVPLIVIPYPGQTFEIPPGEMSFGPGAAARSGQPLVSAGYAVLYPDLPVDRDPAADLADRILAVVDAAASSHPSIDPDRIGLWGHSFGAWAVALAGSQSKRFHAVVALNGPFDPLAVLGTTDLNARVEGRVFDFMIDNSRWLETGQAALGRPYWEVPERYERGSAVHQADRLTAPVLLLQGDQDFNVDQADLLYGALVRLGREPTLITFFGEDHSLFGPGNLRQMYAQTIGWFDRHLMGRAEATPDVIASSAAISPSTAN